VSDHKNARFSPQQQLLMVIWTRRIARRLEEEEQEQDCETGRKTKEEKIDENKKGTKKLKFNSFLLSSYFILQEKNYLLLRPDIYQGICDGLIKSM
jgi:hypothetical protein